MNKGDRVRWLSCGGYYYGTVKFQEKTKYATYVFVVSDSCHETFVMDPTTLERC